MRETRDPQAEARHILDRQAGRWRPLRTALGDAWSACRGPFPTTRPLPAVIVAGTMRGGTTALFHALAGHPQLLPARRKEVHFFDLHHGRGAGWYRRQFPATAAGRLPVEASPYYMVEPRVPERIRALVPDVKLVFLLRDPVERAFSHWRKNRRDGREPLDFGAALDAEAERLAGEEERLRADPRATSPLHRYYSYRRRGHYAEQLARWLTCFPASQLLVLDAGAWFAEPAATFGRLTRFLGLEAWLPERFAVHNAAPRAADVPAAVRAALDDHFAPHERRLEALIGWCPSRPRAAAA